MIVGNPGLDFFVQNPVLAYKTEFADLIKQYGKEKASKIAWATYMIEDPSSILFRIPLDERIEEVKRNYHIDVTEYDDFRTAFRKIALTKEAALYKIHADKLEELTTHLETLDLKQGKDLATYVKIMDKLPKIWEGLEKVKTRMIDQQNKNAVYGGAARSARERR